MKMEKKQGGYALLVVLLVMMFVMVTGVTIYTKINSDTQTRIQEERSAKMRYLAQAGVEEGIYRLHQALTEKKDLPVGPQTIEVSGKPVTYSVKTKGELYVVTAEVADGKGTTRIQAQVRISKTGTQQKLEILDYQRSVGP
ncbi:hypothetical protein KCG48_02440 [Proteiniclasticum sp. BAD-10]|uniref:Uncharacterized protein n=1 Tax=Proteiniclasticum sediminis TaxID=2804028 RepID=A0A941CM41_9CLOT|nr:hypothetical protein [Proteiniclasticum sediminis]MBR0575191.1 hypothetical protein [Proteiniclasticum sediminis]